MFEKNIYISDLDYNLLTVNYYYKIIPIFIVIVEFKNLT